MLTPPLINLTYLDNMASSSPWMVVWSHGKGPIYLGN